MVRLFWADINRVEGPHQIIDIPHAHQAAPFHGNHDMGVAMAFKAGEASRLEFEISNVKVYAFSALPDQHLARGPAKFAAVMGAELVGLELCRFPSEAAFETTQRRRAIRHSCAGCHQIPIVSDAPDTRAATTVLCRPPLSIF